MRSGKNSGVIVQNSYNSNSVTSSNFDMNPMAVVMRDSVSHMSQISEIGSNRLTYKYDAQRGTIISTKLLNQSNKGGKTV